MCVHFNYNARMLVNTYKNEQMLSLNISTQYQQCLQCYCYTLTAMPTRQAGNQPAHKQTTFKYECFISTDEGDTQVIHPNITIRLLQWPT